MKHYYIARGNFSNVYSLFWAETPEQIAKVNCIDCERITRKEAEKMCAKENYRRKHDSGFAYFASAIIRPVDYFGDWMNDKNVFLNGYILEYVK